MLKPSATRMFALERLGVTEEAIQKEVQITPQLVAIAAVIRRAGQSKETKRLVGGGLIESTERHVPPYGPGSDVAKSWPWYLETSDHPDAKKVLAVFYTTPKTLRRACPIEAFCISARVSPLRILEVITATCVRLGAQASNIVAAVNHPRVVQKTVEMALTDEGVEDRAMLHKAAGFLPTPKGAQTNITIAQNASASSTAQAASVAAPPPEQTIRRMADRFNESKMLPADTGATRLLEVMPHEDLEVVDAQVTDEEEEEAEMQP